jgi:hypothetical protein
MTNATVSPTLRRVVPRDFNAAIRPISTQISKHHNNGLEYNASKFMLKDKDKD